MILNACVVAYWLMSFLSLLAGVAALTFGVAVARQWNTGNSSELQYQFEKLVYLSITLLTLGFYMRLALVPLWFFMLQTLIPSIPGAMCLCGVHLLAPPYAFISTALKFALPMAYGYWLVLNALDRKIETQPLMKRKLYALIPLIILMLFEASSDLRFLSAVRPRLVNCCSTLFDDSSSALLQALTYNGWGWVIVYFISAFLLTSVSALLLRRARSRMGVFLWVLGPLTLIAFVLAIHTRLSPLFLHAEFHHCIFCVWQKLPDMVVVTVAVCVGCWASVICATTRRMQRHPDAGGAALRSARPLLQWAIWALLLGNCLLAIRLLIEINSR